MEFKKLISLTVATMAIVSLGSSIASASNQIKSGIFDTQYPGNTASCFICHTGQPGTMTPYGLQYQAAGGTNGNGVLQALIDIEGLDADGDGQTNLQEIQAGTDVNPASTGNTKEASIYGCMTASISTPLALMLIMLTLGVFVRRSKS